MLSAFISCFVELCLISGVKEEGGGGGGSAKFWNGSQKCEGRREKFGENITPPQAPPSLRHLHWFVYSSNTVSIQFYPTLIAV